jgi:hypothetical protein
MALEQTRLTGEDAKLYRMSFGAEVVGNGTLTIAVDTWVKITAKASSGSSFGDLAVGDFYYNNTGVAEVPVAGDKWRVVTLGDMLDLAGWNLDVTAETIDVTTTADRFRKMRNGKLSANGTASVVFIKGITDDPAVGVLNSFYKVVEFDDAGAITVSPVATEPFFLLGYLDYKDNVVGHHKLATALEVEFEGFPLNFRMNEAANVEMPFHLVGATDPVIYRIQNPA